MLNRKWNWGLALLFIAFACLLLLFVNSTSRIKNLVRPLETGHTQETSHRRVILISQELDNPYWRAIEQGAKEAAGQYGMDLAYDGPYRINPSEQSKLLEKSIAVKADAIVLQGIGDPYYRSLIDKAAAQGIPVITVDTDEPASRRLSYVGTDNREAGERMGELVAQAAGHAGSIGVLIGSEQAANQQLRLEGFRSVIGKFPGLAISDVQSSRISRLEAAGQAETMLKQNPQIRYMVGFSALDGAGIQEAAVRIRPREVRIFAFDDVPETVEGIRTGQIAATIVQQPHDMGYKAIALLNEYFLGKVVQPQNFTDTTVLDRNSPGLSVKRLLSKPDLMTETSREPTP
ncbi:substrate-binding domain-containing protein [Paenibacillus sedimenti]|uniref:Substrate-binding domain-containing protein n=1 Tax=Paenibacillus sedimenti TaxID=2770274 RepID=A0A926QHY5_9BACL|nr:substrate-binding domain-containing protein [Paenibacillus sedimenti]MBD0379975.1 substrate-binding domain-containing protein [Paenibacillus sedimenti]